MSYFHWQKWIGECGKLGMNCRTVGEMLRKENGCWAAPASLTQSPSLNMSTIYVSIFLVSGIPSSDLHHLSLKLFFSTVQTVACTWTPVGFKIRWSYFSWLLTHLNFLLPPFTGLYCMIHHCKDAFGFTPCLSLCHAHLAKIPILFNLAISLACPYVSDHGWRWACSHLISSP